MQGKASTQAGTAQPFPKAFGFPSRRDRRSSAARFTPPGRREVPPAGGRAGGMDSAGSTESA